MAIASLAMMGELELMGRVKKAKARKAGRAFAAIATGGASLIGRKLGKKIKARKQAKMQKRISAAVAARTPAQMAPVAAVSPLSVAVPPIAAPAAEEAMPVVEQAPALPEPIPEPIPEPTAEPEVAMTPEPEPTEPTEEPMVTDEYGGLGAEAAEQIELMGKASKKKRKKIGRVFAAIATGGASAAARKVKKARAKIKKQTAGMSKTQKKKFLRKKIARGFAVVGTGGLAAIGAKKRAKKQMAKRASAARPTAAVAAAAATAARPAAAHPAAGITTGVLRAPLAKRSLFNPMSNVVAVQGRAAQQAFPARVTAAAVPAQYTPVRVQRTTPFAAPATPQEFGGPQPVRYMSISEWARYLFAPTFADSFRM